MNIKDQIKKVQFYDAVQRGSYARVGGYYAASVGIVDEKQHPASVSLECVMGEASIAEQSSRGSKVAPFAWFAGVSLAALGVLYFAPSTEPRLSSLAYGAQTMQSLVREACVIGAGNLNINRYTPLAQWIDERDKQWDRKENMPPREPALGSPGAQLETFLAGERISWKRTSDGQYFVVPYTALKKAELLELMYKHPLVLVGVDVDELKSVAGKDRVRRLAVGEMTIEDMSEFLAGYSALEMLSFEGSRIGDIGACSIAGSEQLGGLAYLNLRENNVGAAGAQAIAGSKYLRLRHIDLGYNDIKPEGAKALASSENMGKLTYLDLRWNVLGKEAVQAIARSERMSGLTHLILRATHPEDAGVVAIAGSEHMKNLQYLDIGYARADSAEGNGIDALVRSPHMARLRHLDLRQNWVFKRGAEALARSEHLGKLEYLNLTSGGILNEGVRAIADSVRMSKLTELHLGWNGIGAEGVHAIASSEHMAQLERLSLDNNNTAGDSVGDGGARALARSEHMVQLRHLDLRNCGVGERGAERVVRGLTGLRWLDLSNNAVSEECVRNLRGLSGAQIVFVQEKRRRSKEKDEDE